MAVLDFRVRAADDRPIERRSAAGPGLANTWGISCDLGGARLTSLRLSFHLIPNLGPMRFLEQQAADHERQPGNGHGIIQPGINIPRSGAAP